MFVTPPLLFNKYVDHLLFLVGSLKVGGVRCSLAARVELTIGSLEVVVVAVGFGDLVG